MSSVEFIGIHKINRKKAQVKTTQKKKIEKWKRRRQQQQQEEKKQHGLIKYED